MIGQNDGVRNEEEISNYIDENMYSRLSTYWKGFIKEIDPDISLDGELKSKKIGGQGLKPDIVINTDNTECAVSIKKGSGNSVHQEKTLQFIDYCKLYLGMSEEEEESLLLFLYGDGSIDGSAPKEDRLDLEEVKSVFKKEIEIVQDFFDRNKEELLLRFLVYGKDGLRTKRKADYIYHGTIEGGIRCPLNSYMIGELAKMPRGDNALAIGPLGFQVWNRNPSDTQEKRRHSIQIKWSSCKMDLQNLYERCMEYKRRVERKVLGDNSHGFNNQTQIVNFFSKSKVKDFADVFRKMLMEINPVAKANDDVDACLINEKARVKIKVGNVEKKVSVFMGSGNSVHQEKIDGFIEFCESLGMTQKEKEAFLRVHYADGSLDGTGVLENRLDGKKSIKDAYSSELEIAQNFLDKHKKKMIERFLIYGKDGIQNNHRVDYIYYGTYKNGAYASSDTMVDYLVELENAPNAVLSVGPLSIQMWNRNLSGKESTEYKRHSIQVKWGKLRDHIYNAYELNLVKKVSKQKGTSEGTSEEYNLVRELNMHHNISNDSWQVVSRLLKIDSLDNIYAVRVTSHVKSNLSGKSVLPKSDIYLAKIDLKDNFLIENNYVIDEEMFENELVNVDVCKVYGSGISCKIRSSRSFTYEKMTVDTFVKLFKEPALGCGMSLFVKNAEELALNENALNAWHISYDDFVAYWKSYIDIDGDSNIIINQEICKSIKKKSDELMREIIDNDVYVRNAIFRGDGIFEEPYNATMIYSHGKLDANSVDTYKITTGSGRHKGKYTIIIKP